ncbi:protein serine/threonine phosphatase 2C, partial [Metschnikowia bicuspidata var. bicuspidata NRRL YB-4993]
SAVSAAYNYDQTSFDRLLAYQIAVLFQPKTREHTNVFTRRLPAPAPATLLPLGEDNLFVSAQDADGYIAVGVADGVGGWAEAGYDSSAILRELCHQAKTRFEAAAARAALSPRDLLVRAFEDVQQSPKVEIGGTTACFGVLTPDRRLKVANLGDSWCGLFRGDKLVHETRVQTHNFNTPYQLAKIPQQVLRQAELQGKRYIIDSPDRCDEYVWDLQKDDVVIFATDGVTDNVVAQDIEVFLRDQSAQRRLLPQISLQLVQEVVAVSKDPNYPSAFAQELSRLTGQRYMGGKEDDITVVMVKV